MIRKLVLMASLMPLAALATTWYVNGSTGSDSNSGTSESAPKATIQATIDASAAGDTLLVAPGTYAPISTDNKAITIRSTSGATSTIIDGGGTNRCVTALDNSPSVCTNTRVYGFTLQNGIAKPEYLGGQFGGGARCGTYYDCVLLNNAVNVGGGGGACWAVLHNCLLKGNYAINGGATESCVCYNCTIIENSVRDSGVVGWDSAFINCIIYGNEGWSSFYYAQDDGAGAPTHDLNYCKRNCFEGDPGFVDAANGDYRLAAGSPCIDAGDNSYVTTTTDLAGNARIANGTVDIGCYEYGAEATPELVPVSSLLHRWSLNGTLTDSVTGESAMTVGDVTTDGSSYILPGGSGYISLGDVYPTDATNLTIEIWATQISTQYYSLIFRLGTDMQSDFNMEWSLATMIDYDELGCKGLGIDNSGLCTHLAPYTLGTEFHISVVVERQADGRSKVTYSKRNSVSGEVIKKCEFMSPSGWSLAVNPATDMYLGYNPVEVDAHACYNEMRIWNAALTSEQLTANVLLGPDTLPFDITGGNTCTVTFDLNGADGAAPAQRLIAEGAVVGALPTATREGYEFLGWHVGSEASSDEVTASTVVTADMTVYAVWRINSYTVTFDANGGEGGTVMALDYGTALTAPTVSRTGYTFTGWSPAVAATVPASDVTYIAQWLVNSYTVTFDANGGSGGATRTQDYGTALTAPTVSREGYTFTGWLPSVPSVMPAENRTYTAQWRINSYTVTFDAQGGAGGGTVARNHGAALGELPVPTRDGFSFDGWFTAASGGTEVSSATVITGAVTFYAHWTEQSLYQTPVWYDEDGEEIDWTQYYDGDEEPFAAESAATFDGYVLDGEEVCGVVQVKVGKANKKTETAKVTAALTLLGDPKKRSYKGTMSKRGIAELTCSGKGNLSLCLGTNAMWGEVEGLSVSGARNVFAKAGDPKAAALSRWQGAYTLVLETVDADGSGSAFAWGYSGLTVTVGAKGKVKIAGTMVDGAKVNVSSQLLAGERRCCVPVVVPLYSKKGGFGFNLWLQDDGEIEVGELGEWDAAASKTPFRAWFGEYVPVARAGGALPSSLSFMFMGEPDVAGAEVLYDFVPWEVSITTGARWGLPAAGNVKFDRESEEYVDAKNSSNAAGVKLTYVAKTGAFKGSFKLYAVDGSGRLKKVTAKVSGVMVGRQGYGTATVKGVGSWPVAIQ